MIEQQTEKTDYAALVEEKEVKLLLMQEEVLSFVDTKHKAKDTKKYIKGMKEEERALNKILFSLKDPKNISTEFTEEAKALCEKIMKIKERAYDIRKELKDDLARLEGNKVDVIKVGSFTVAFPVMFTALGRSFLGQDFGDEKLAAAGLFLGVAIVSYKKIGSAWEAASNAVCGGFATETHRLCHRSGWAVIFR
ncbi:MAG: hypothetical protein FWF24_03950 [Alphaproteobacteria bacterium]|nr:hypothetical protein [Alphaproteobacteria bacterium]